MSHKLYFLNMHNCNNILWSFFADSLDSVDHKVLSCIWMSIEYLCLAHPDIRMCENMRAGLRIVWVSSFCHFFLSLRRARHAGTQCYSSRDWRSLWWWLCSTLVSSSEDSFQGSAIEYFASTVPLLPSCERNSTWAGFLSITCLRTIFKHIVYDQNKSLL